jgi:hypothetical protein
MKNTLYLATNVIIDRDGNRIILPKGTPVVVGKDITQDQAQRFLEGGEASENPLSEASVTPDQKTLVKELKAVINRIAELTAIHQVALEDLKKEKTINNDLQKELDEAKDLITELATENDNLRSEKTELKAALAPVSSLDDQGDKKEGKKK